MVRKVKEGISFDRVPDQSILYIRDTERWNTSRNSVHMRRKMKEEDLPDEVLNQNIVFIRGRTSEGDRVHHKS